MTEKTYKIKKGSQYSSWLPNLTTKRNFKFEFTFIGDPSYELTDGDQDDINKLFGVSDGLHHHTNSIRFGWRWDLKKKQIEILAYAYNDGVFRFKSMGYVDANKTYEGIIQIHKSKYVLFLNGRVCVMTRTSKWCLIRYELHPYFGGNKVAPKDFSIKITKR